MKFYLSKLSSCTNKSLANDTFSNLWSRFDRIVCIHYLPYEDRLPNIKNELKRVGILDLPQFEWYYTIDNCLYQYVLSGIPDNRVGHQLNGNKRVDNSNINYTIDSYSLLKKLNFFQYNRVLILEDDIKFRKDIDSIQKTLESTPLDFDIVNYDPRILHSSDTGDIIGVVTKVNDRIFKCNNTMITNTSCFALSKRGIRWMLDNQDNVLEPFDICTWHNSNKVNMYCVREGENICVQDLDRYDNRQSDCTFETKYPLVNKNDFWGNDFQVVVSLTSYPHRFMNDDFLQCLKSLVQQKTNVNYKIVLNVFSCDIPKLPECVLKYARESDIEILPHDFDIRQHKKYLKVMQKYSQSCVITVDDDQEYRDNLVDDLWKTHMENPGFIVCGRCDKMAKDESGKVLPYEKWEQMVNIPNYKDNSLFGVGVGGILYPSEFCKFMSDNVSKLIPEIKSDDCLLFILANILGFKYMTVNTKSKFTNWGGGGFLCKRPLKYYNDEKALWVVNRTSNYKDKCLRYFYQYDSIDGLIDDILGKKKSQFSVGVVAIARLENPYINEWIEYHKHLGFNHFYIYDNSFGQEEHIDHALTPENACVTTIIPAYNKKFYQKQAYTEAYQKFGVMHNYLMFLDIDEFFTLCKHKTISDYMSYLDSKCPGFTDVRINWELYDDNNAITRDLKVPVHQFFTQLASTKYAHERNAITKCIIKTGLPGIIFNSEHYAETSETNLLTCNSVGKVVNSKKFIIGGDRDVSVAKIRHYMTKTISEYMFQKLCRDDASGYIVRDIENRFFVFCERTKQKMEFYENNKGKIRRDNGNNT